MTAVIDYGAGNTASVVNVLSELGDKFIITNDKKILQKSDRIILPGVGEAASAMNRIKELDLISFIQNYKNPFLGVCLGMQLLCERSTEGNVECLGIIKDLVVEKFNNENMKVPHMGWNNIEIINQNKLYKSLESGDYFYFANSYYVPICTNTLAVTNYGITFSSSVAHENFYGVQFHPEKSSDKGIQLIKNFLEL